MCKLILSLVSITICLLSLKAHADICAAPQELMHISFAQNSSYFSAYTSQQLDELKAQIKRNTSSSSLLIEIGIDQFTIQTDLFDYNKWLALRRLQRVREALEPTGKTMITRLKTAEDHVRELTIYQCQRR